MGNSDRSSDFITDEKNLLVFSPCDDIRVIISSSISFSTLSRIIGSNILFSGISLTSCRVLFFKRILFRAIPDNAELSQNSDKL